MSASHPRAKHSHPCPDEAGATQCGTAAGGSKLGKAQVRFGLVSGAGRGGVNTYPLGGYPSLPISRMLTRPTPWGICKTEGTMDYRSEIAADVDEPGPRARAAALLRAGGVFTSTAGRWISKSMNDDATGVHGFVGSLVATAMCVGALLSLRLFAPGVWDLIGHYSAGNDELFGTEVLILLSGVVVAVCAALRVLAAVGRRFVSLAWRLKRRDTASDLDDGASRVPLAGVSSEGSVQRGANHFNHLVRLD